MGLTIPDNILQAARMSEGELRQEIAVLLYQKQKLSLGQACKLAQMFRIPFQHLLASELKADLLLMDEKKGRAAATRLGLNRVGLLGLLIEAKQKNLTPMLRLFVK